MNRATTGGMATYILICSFIWIAFTGCQTKPYQQELAETYYNLGNAYIELEQWDAAETAFARAIEIMPEMYRAEYNMARVHINSRNYKSAIDILAKLLERDPENIIFLETLAWAEVKRSSLARAEEIYRDLIEKDPANCNVRYNLALMLHDRQEYAEAYSLLLECVQNQSADSEILLQIGNLEQELGWGEGVGWFERALEKSPQDTKVQQSLADTYVQQSRFTEALEMYRRLAGSSQGSERGRYLLKRARILFLELEEQEQARGAFESALQAGYKDVATLADFYAAIVEQENSEMLTGVESQLRAVQLLEPVQAAAGRNTPADQ